ncbi:PLDc N-terminal domain-containing protein [Microbacterium paludicola]|uniref:PLDc N-terminal domain-containing protein n=1 Tax=Microbacterium paludicola TaxID=300019 RepID=UPI0011A4A7D2|nr:PLD nuclease N-terminal domain-containing protein [Microbacterium paludicola]
MGRKKDISKMSPAGKAALAVVGIVQAAFAVLAFWDLARRGPDELRGPKPAWIPVILVNWIGPAAYFAFGVRRDTR